MIPQSIATGQRHVILFGASGQLGRALASALSAENRPFTPVARAPGWEDRIVSVVAAGKPVDVVFAGGLTDPRLPYEELRGANVLLPRAVAGLVGPVARYLTFGTVLELLEGADRVNPYVRSKAELAALIARFPPGSALHLRLHTLYGAKASPHMFLGQMVAALSREREFKMSEGSQLREYHHVDDVAQSILRLLAHEWTGLGASLELSTGRPVRLADLARGVFEMLGSENQLQIGALPRAEVENLERVFPASPEWLLGNPRESVSGVIESLSRQLAIH